MKQVHISKCDSTGYFIEFIIDNDVALMETVNTDYVHMKAFINLIRLSSGELIKKNIKTIQQSVTYDDWDTILKNKTTWKIIASNEQYKFYNIECDINDFLCNFGKAMDIPAFLE